ncbi:MAG TPA: hypothetical protein VM370_04775 [Candidatus Thermoplasmatota archaeon]|nr:hypothetical protein [Candidatus Thermoplasmatota archaeon]
MRALLLVAIFLAVTFSPVALADPSVDHGIDDGCASEGARVLVRTAEVMGAAVSAGDHCAYVIVTP